MIRAVFTVGAHPRVRLCNGKPSRAGSCECPGRTWRGNSCDCAILPTKADCRPDRIAVFSNRTLRRFLTGVWRYARRFQQDGGHALPAPRAEQAHGQAMNGKTPHIVQYQGSKRKLAPQILQYMPKKFNRLVEPFSGMAAISIAVAIERRTNRFHINDLNRPLIAILEHAINKPDLLAERYSRLWREQFNYKKGHIEHFYSVRNAFNNGDVSPEVMLYLVARCVKGSVRYGSDGKFNQSPDKRRHGTSPDNMKKNIYCISNLLKGKVEFSSLDYRDIFDIVEEGDIVYMDPPYQGVTDGRDSRYLSGVRFEEFVAALEILNAKGIDFLVSYDGECGGKTYGKSLPSHLGCKKILLNAGVSTQATLLGANMNTLESLYISKGLIQHGQALRTIQKRPCQLSFFETAAV